MSLSDSSQSLQARLAFFAEQAHVFTLEQGYRVADAQSTYDQGKPAGESRRDQNRRDLKRRSRVRKYLKILQSSPNATPAGPLRWKAKVVAALPIEDPELVPGPLFSSDDPHPAPDVDLARFFYAQWARHYDLARQRLDLYCHPFSVNYDVPRELKGRTEWGIPSIQITEILRRLYCSDQAADRAAARTFERARGRINWDEHKPSDVASFYRPEATYVRDGRKKIAVCLPEAFYWDLEPAIVEFLAGFRRLFAENGMPYEFWCPGLCRCPESSSELEAFLSRVTSG
jgi:hypothetical protein